MDGSSLRVELIEMAAVLELPGNESDAGEIRGGKATRKTAQRGAEAEAHVEDARRFAAEMDTNVKAIEDFAIHLLEHGFAIEGVHASAKESEVHVETGTPCGVVRAGFFVVALKLVG